MILKSISVVVWVLWLQLIVGLGIEVWAHLQGRVAPRVIFVPSFIQRLSTRLMGTALFVAFSVQNPGIAVADNQDLLAPTTIELDVGSLDTQSVVHTVERHDSLRMLAEQYLGDPDRWTEVFVLNQGQAQAVGGSLTDPARLQPGWELVMPADAHPTTPADLKADQASDRNPHPGISFAQADNSLVTVEHGDTLWSLAAHHFDDPDRWVDIYESNQDIIQDPNMILPGWQLQIPARDLEPTIVEIPLQPLPEPTHPATPPLSKQADQYAPATQPLPEPMDRYTAVTAYATATPTVTANIPQHKSEGHSAPSREAMFTIGGLGVFASSLGWVLARLRRTQRRRLPNGRMPLPPSQKAVQLDLQLQAASDPNSALFLDAALRVMSSRVADDPPPEVIGVTLDMDSISIHLGSPAAPPPGFNASTDSMTWTHSRDGVLEPLLAEADGVAAPLPTLATFGKSNGKECLLNLEHLVAVSLEGDSEAINELCAAIATQLASSHLADDLTVMCVGFGQELTVFERVEYVPDVDTAIERIGYQQRQNQALLGNHPPVLDSRIGSSGDYWHPMVALIPHRLDEEAPRLLESCGSSVCVVAHGLEGAPWVVQFDRDGLLLMPIGLRLEIHGLAEGDMAAFAELASSAKDTEGVALTVPKAPLHDQALPDVDPMAVDIEVRVMGSVDVLGAAQPFTSRRAMDLVTYLAFHPEGADRDQLKTQIWPPDDPPSESTLANTVSRARKALGINDDGDPYLPRVSSEGIYRLRTEVGTDVGRFEALVSSARDDVSERGRVQLQTALELVRGTPFTGGAGDMYRWADFGLRTRIDCLVDNTAHDLAKRCIDVGDFQGARKAVMTSLQLVGVCEQCYRWRLIAAAENPTEVRQIMAELVGLLRRESDQPEADDLISPDLLELYEQLMSGRLVFSYPAESALLPFAGGGGSTRSGRRWPR
ncbi:MAG: LysM peptidoglycan-binding domain-containing protein [bacterium]|nr:LysM peptidoglycan-binding domain-containing protein [bacterium]